MNPSNKIHLCVYSVSSSYAQYFHPPCTGAQQSRRGPASISMMRHLSHDSSGPRFVLHLDKKRHLAGDSAVDVVTAETEETSVFLPFYTRTAPGCWRARWCCVACPLLRALSQSGECLGRRGHSPPPHWSPQGKQTVPRTLVSRPQYWSLLLHMYNIGDITQTVSNRNHVLYRTRKLGRMMVLLYEKRGAFSL